MSAAAAILLPIAVKIGAKVVKGLLQKHVGGEAGRIGETVIDAVAQEAGVRADELAGVPEAQLERAVAAVENHIPELLAHFLSAHELSVKLQMAEMAKDEATWTWAWRPAGMYLLGFWWTCYILFYPALNLMLKLAGVSAGIQIGVDVTTLLAISGGYISLYMGGYTALKGIEKWKTSP